MFPDHVAGGQLSTGVIVVTGGTEYILDFVRNLPRPNMIVARVILPHGVMPQFIEALTTNISLYRQRFGDLTPQLTNPSIGVGETPITGKMPGQAPSPGKPSSPWSEPLDVLPGVELGGGKSNDSSGGLNLGSSSPSNPECPILIRRPVTVNRIGLIRIQ